MDYDSMVQQLCVAENDLEKCQSEKSQLIEVVRELVVSIDTVPRTLMMHGENQRAVDMRRAYGNAKEILNRLGVNN
jgi:hypothetical protein